MLPQSVGRYRQPVKNISSESSTEDIDNKTEDEETEIGVAEDKNNSYMLFQILTDIILQADNNRPL